MVAVRGAAGHRRLRLRAARAGAPDDRDARAADREAQGDLESDEKRDERDAHEEHQELLEVQPEGKPRMDAVSWANGARWSADQAFGS